MKYTAVSQVLEQAVKLAAGLIITSMLKRTPALAAAGAERISFQIMPWVTAG